jgi:AGZA family xanthine/uracil permease-like MFS transporter
MSSLLLPPSYLATKKIGYKEALAAAFIEGWIFIFLSITGVRARLIELIPRHIMYATAAGRFVRA